jgi:Fe-S cluster assembly iron-binding protein IscA
MHALRRSVLATRVVPSVPSAASSVAAAMLVSGSWLSATAAISTLGRAYTVAATAAAAAAASRRALFASATASAHSRFPRSLHSSTAPIRRFTNSTVLSAVFTPAGVAPVSPSFDAPLPTLAPVARLDPSELEVDASVGQRLATLSAKTGHPVHLRVLVDQGGCSGLEYKFEVIKDPEAAPEEEDVVCPAPAPAASSENTSSAAAVHSNSVWVDRDSWLWLRGSRIEYVQELARAAFVVAANPNATQACGCKSSFAPKVDPRTGQPIAETSAATAAAAATATAQQSAPAAPRASL